MKKKTLLNSAFIAAMAATLPASIAAAGTAVHTDQASFDIAVAGGGHAFAYGEDFESYTVAGPYSIFAAPWSSSVAPDLSIAGISPGDNLFLMAGSYYFPSIVTNAMGTLEGSAVVLNFANGVSSVGMEVFGISSFTSGYFSEINYSVFDMAGGLLGSGMYDASGEADGFFGVLSDSALIGSVEVYGTRFDGALNSQQYVDNIVAYSVPAPSALAVLGLGGMVIGRRRR